MLKGFHITTGLSAGLLLTCFLWAGCKETPDTGSRTDTQRTDTDSHQTSVESSDSTASDNNGSDSHSAVSTDGNAVLGMLNVAPTTGTFWKYGWDLSKSTSSGFGTSSSSSDDSGVFWVELGDATVVSGVTFYEIILSGDAAIGENPVTRWKYMGVADNRIYVSENGSILVALMDAGDIFRNDKSHFASTFHPA